MNDCKFCQLAERPDLDFGLIVAFRDAYPVTTGHYLVIPRIHRADAFELSAGEWSDTRHALKAVRAELLSEDSTITGFNVGWNCGDTAGQTVMHAHLHVIPRRLGDVTDPFGGIRGVIPERRRY